MQKLIKLISVAIGCAVCTWAAAPDGKPVEMIVTVGHQYGHEEPALRRDDLTVTQHYEPVPVTKLLPLRGEHASLELFLLVDNCSNCDPDSKFEELRRFIGSQPATTSVGVAYIRDGRLEVIEKPTTNRERAIKALSVPAGSTSASPFPALAELIKGWHENSSRHAVLMISNGIDPAAVGTLPDRSADAAIEAAQRARVTVYAIYHPSADYASSGYSKIISGQVQLAHVAVETGGEGYFLGFGPLPSLAPFLDDIAAHLANQYLLEFLAKPPAGPGSFVEVRVKTSLPYLELMVPNKVWVPGTLPAPSVGEVSRRNGL